VFEIPQLHHYHITTVLRKGVTRCKGLTNVLMRTLVSASKQFYPHHITAKVLMFVAPVRKVSLN